MTFIEKNKDAKITILGVGGAGRNAIKNMIQAGLAGVKFIYADTNKKALENSAASIKIQLGEKLTSGLGAGANPEVGRSAAEESIEAVKKAIQNSHMCFIAAGFGGGTGTGAAPVIARLCREWGALTVCVVSKPFSFEGRKKRQIAETGIKNLYEIAHAVVTIPNDRLRNIASKEARAVDMFRKADEILHHSIQGITDLIKVKGLVNLDFADVRSTMENTGKAMIGFGSASGSKRAIKAIEQAISHPLLEDVPLSGAQGALLNITSSSDITMEEMITAMDRIYSEVGENTDIYWGQTINDNLDETVQVTVIVTGIDARRAEAPFT